MLPSNILSFRANTLPAATVSGQTAEQSQGEQRQTRWLGERFGIEEIVHHHDVVIQVAENTVAHDRIEARCKSNPADPLAGIGHPRLRVSATASQASRRV